MKRPYTRRLDERFILFENQYPRLSTEELNKMFAEHENRMSERQRKEGIANFGQAMYFRKFDSDFPVEMSRSVRLILKEWMS